jgi:hypothetical protein
LHLTLSEGAVAKEVLEYDVRSTSAVGAGASADCVRLDRPATRSVTGLAAAVRAFHPLENLM